VYDYGAYGDLLRCPDYANERVVEKRRADPLPLVAGIDS
jgi:hypothetical protein